MPDSDDDSRTKRAKTEIRRYPVDPMSAPSTASARDSECGTGTSFLPPNRREAPRNGTENLAGQYPAGSISATVRQAPPPLLQGNRARRYSFLSPNRSTSPRSTRQFGRDCPVEPAVVLAGGKRQQLAVQVVQIGNQVHRVLQMSALLFSLLT